jgi:hypothetical protein
MKNVTFEIEGIEYFLPDYINIDNYVKVFKIKDIFSDQYFAAKILNIITGAPLETLLEVNYKKISMLATHVMTLFPTGKPMFIDKFELNGVMYGFLPTWQEVSFAEYVDLDTLITKNTDELLNYIHIITAIMYRPIVGDSSTHKFKIEKYDQDTLNDRAELFKKELDIKYFLGGQFFFINFAKKFSEHSHLSLTTKKTKMEQIKMLWKYRRTIWKSLSSKGLDGSQLSIELRKTMLQDTIQSSKEPLWQRLINYSTSLKKTRNLKRE